MFELDSADFHQGKLPEILFGPFVFVCLLVVVVFFFLAVCVAP